MSPKGKKRKQDREEKVVVDNDIIIDVDMAEEDEKETERKIIDVEVLEEEDCETVTNILEKQNDQKVLLKQQTWFEKEVKFQEFKKNISEEQRKEENKRKRQNSIRKRKNSEAKIC